VFLTVNRHPARISHTRLPNSGRWLGVVVLSLVAGACGSATADLSISDARIRALIPGQDKTAGYFAISNSGTTDVVLVGARSSGIPAIEMHTVIREGDMVRMRRLRELIIPAGTTVNFQPGGNHLMLFGLQQLAQDTEIELITASGRALTARFRQIPLGADT
jgi:copper(I)-binding protein